MSGKISEFLICVPQGSLSKLLLILSEPDPTKKMNLGSVQAWTTDGSQPSSDDEPLPEASVEPAAATEALPPEPASSHLPVDPEPVTELYAVNDLIRLQELLKYKFDERWDCLRAPYTPVAQCRIGRARAIQGESIKMYCALHGARCKLHLDIKGRFEACQCFLLRWIAEADIEKLSVEDHIASSITFSSEWLDFCSRSPA